MQTMLLRKPEAIEKNPLQLVEIEKPKVRAGEILVKIRVCGICHTDLHTVEGELELPKKPLVPGHQVVGVVGELGENVTRFKEGRSGGDGLASFHVRRMQVLPGRERESM